MSIVCECGCGREPDLATRTRPYLGTVKGQPLRFIKGHGRRSLQPKIEDRGHSSPCWIWQRSVYKTTGYGEVRERGIRTTAHRFFYERAKGPVPQGKELHHLCAVRLCVNPEHLIPVTRQEHIRLERALVTASDVRAIRNSSEPHKVLAHRFGISHHHVSAIRSRKVWKDIT